VQKNKQINELNIRVVEFIKEIAKKEERISELESDMAFNKFKTPAKPLTDYLNQSEVDASVLKKRKIDEYVN
jgi:hypothetical protein